MRGLKSTSLENIRASMTRQMQRIECISGLRNAMIYGAQARTPDVAVAAVVAYFSSKNSQQWVKSVFRAH